MAAALAMGACDTNDEGTPDRLEPDDGAALAVDAAGDLVAEADPAAVLPGFPLQVSASGADVSLSWAATGASYEVWRSPAPYFAPGDPGTELLGSTNALSFVDVGVGCPTCEDRYYAVRAITGDDAVVSTSVGAHVIAVYDGYNKIPISLINPTFDQGNDLQTLGGTGFVAGHRFNAATQAWQSWMQGAMVYVPLLLGESPVLHLTLGAPSFRMFTGSVPAPGDVVVDLLPGDNLVVLPLTHPDTPASALLAAIPQATRIGRWDAVLQVTHWYDGTPGSTDFVVPSGGDLHVEVTSAMRWPLPLPPAAQPPTTGLGGADHFDVRNDRVYNSAGGALLANDAPGVTVVGHDPQSANGAAIVVLANGSFTYAPASIAWGDDSFQYTVSDGVTEEVVTVELFVQPLSYTYTDIGGPLPGYGFAGPVTIVGDVNGDGLDDVAWSQGTSGPNRSYVAFGVVHPAPLPSQANIEAGVGGFYIDNARLPRQVGDVNGDGLADVLVGNGWPGRTSQFGQYNNDNWLVYGKAVTAPVTPATLAVGGGFHIDLDHIDNSSAASYTGYGSHLPLTLRGIGDFDGDGLHDFVVAAAGHDWPYRGAPGYVNNAGVVFVVLGKAGGAEVPLPDVLTGTYAGSDVFVFRGNAEGAYCGYSGWMRDADGDGRSDLLMYCGTNRYLVRGRPHPGGVPISIMTDGSDPGINQLPSIGALFSQQVISTVGDWNGDGLSDAWRRDGILYGAPGAAALTPQNLLAGVGGMPVALISNAFELRPLGDADGDGYDDTVYYHGGYIPSTTLVWGRPGGFIDFTRDPATFGGIHITIGQGVDWDGTGDVDGDGFDDTTLWFQLLMGDRYSDAVGLLGQDGDDALVGTAGDDVAVGGRGDDVLELGAGIDAARGGAGDDTIVVEGLGFRRVDGGTGEDTLAIVDAGSDLDLASVYAHRLTGVEVLDLSDAGAVALSLRAIDVGRLSGTSNTLTILAGDDTIVSADLAGEGFVPAGDGTWSNGVLTLVVQGGLVDVTL